MRSNEWLVSTLVLVLCACGGLGAAETKLGPGDEFLVSSIQGDIKKAKERAKDDALGALMSCSAARKQAAGLAPKAKDSSIIAAVVKDAEQVCGHDVPLDVADQQTAKAEDARKAQGKGGVLSECYSAEMTMALKEIGEGKPDDERLAAVKARWAKACPQK